ncbi:MAG TPA: DHH family phosphoesterase [Tepidisphaeraceae bacterium]|nr:DHH family phosphoesterase [Tepidisphaeraceae bacterium]
MHRPKRWNLASPHPSAQELAGRLKTSVLVAQVLLNRGVSEFKDCQDFLRPSLKCLHDPFLIPGLRKASERIAQAIRDKQKIVIYGDYDVDGITATSILWHAIRVLGGSAEFYIPHRIEEGYGLNPEAIAQLCDAGAKLIISVDCGITAVEPARVARDRGVDLIITDHHEWHEANAECRMPNAESPNGAPKTTPLLPDCYAIVHPRLPNDGPAYPNPALCGAGVAFKLAWGIGLAVSGAVRVNEAFREFLVEATALAALGTIADVVPLVGENRILAYFGLSGLKASKLTGIRALIESANLTGQKLDSFHVGFLLAPRLNACGRMGHARLAVEMLTTEDFAKATEIATYLEQQNRARQAIEKKIVEQAMAQIADGGWDKEGKCAIVLGDESWHPGVIGIVASRIVDRFHRPAIMVALNNGHGQGSGRSIAGFHLAHALEACAEHLDAFGGHEMAAGLKVQTAKFEGFRQSFCEHASRMVSAEMLLPEIKLDALAEIGHMSAALVTDLTRLGPFGHGNRRPILCFKGVEVSAPPRRVGRSGDHLQLHVRQDGLFIKCIAFGYGELYDHLKVGTRIDLAVEPTLNEYNGSSSVELEVKDIQFPTM